MFVLLVHARQTDGKVLSVVERRLRVNSRLFNRGAGTEYTHSCRHLSIRQARETTEQLDVIHQGRCSNAALDRQVGA